MYAPFQLARKYVWYVMTALNGKGHGVHSPFVFDFITHILNDTTKYAYFDTIEALRGKLLQDTRMIDVEDFGAGSATMSARNRRIRDIARASLKNKKFAQLLYRIVRYYQPRSLIELGTSLGITTSYIAAANRAAMVHTLEGSNNIAKIARDNFQQIGLDNLHLTVGNFDETLPRLLAGVDAIDFAFVDGNHRRQPTLEYFSALRAKSVPSSILIFDDIHWSEEMEEAWKQIRGHESVTLTIDLFFIGIVFFRADFKVKQHFTIRF